MHGETLKYILITYRTSVLNIPMQTLRSHYAQYVHQLMYVTHPDIQCISLYMLNFVRTHFMSKQTINCCCSTFIF